MISPGPMNSICDVAGIRVGNAEALDLTTGVTVVLPETAAPAVVDHRGGGIGSRGTAVLAPGSAMPEIHAITLSGGSAYGLDAAGGVMHALREAGFGYSMASEIVPIVPCSIIFDLLTGGPKTWDKPPWWSLGRQALSNANRSFRLGNVGAGVGATAGCLKGGLGTASFVAGNCTVGALAVVNPMGSVVIPGTRTFWAWQFARGDEVGTQKPPPPNTTISEDVSEGPALANTTLAVVATDVRLSRDELLRIAIMAQDGIARAIRPVHSPLDGDTVYVLSTMQREMDATPAAVTCLGSLAADAVARSIMRGVYEAEPLAGVPAYREFTP